MATKKVKLFKNLTFNADSSTGYLIPSMFGLPQLVYTIDILKEDRFELL